MTRKSQSNRRRAPGILLALVLALALLAPVANAQPTPGAAQMNMELVDNEPITSAVGVSQSDLAWWGDTMYAGYYQGFRIFDVSNPENTVQLADIKCNNNQGDVSIWDNLLVVSIDVNMSGPACDDVQIGGSHPNYPGWEGIRIFDVSDPEDVELVTTVATDCGSHTNTLFPDLDNDRVLVYISSQAGTYGDTAYGTSCNRVVDGVPEPGFISVVEIPLDDPDEASVINKPTFEINDFRGVVGSRGCHDIGVFLELEIAAAACHSEGQLWDISDPVNPVTLARFHHPSVDIWHSGAFSNDGELIIFGDEFAGGGGPGCDDPNDDIGRIYFYDRDSSDLLGTYKVPREQDTDGVRRVCTMHNYNMIPTPLGNYLVSASNMAGTTVVDFNDPANAKEIAFFDANPPTTGVNNLASPWSSYWYNDYIYANDRRRGVDVLKLLHHAGTGAQTLPYLNPQVQVSVIEQQGLAEVREELDALVAAGGITDYTEAKIRHALDMFEAWREIPGKMGPALSHLNRAANLLEWQAGVVEKGKTNQGDAEGLRALAATIRALEQAYR